MRSCLILPLKMWGLADAYRVLAPSRVQSLDVSGPADVFYEAAKRLGDTAAYEVQVMSNSLEPISATGGLRFIPARTIYDPDEPIDTLLVAGVPSSAAPSFQLRDPEIIQWLQRRAPTARRFGSVCTGVFYLAAAGLLKGRRVTTHWEAAARLQNEYPELEIDADKIFIRDGSLYTNAGGTSSIDLALALVEEDYGRNLAVTIARYFVMFLKRSGGQSQFSAHLAAQISNDTRIQKVQEYVLDNLRLPLSVSRLARTAGMSTRNFVRVFQNELSMTPTEFVDAARLDAARRLLEDTALPIKQVALRSGFATADRMRRAFIRRLGVSPSNYRRGFCPAWTRQKPLEPKTNRC